MWKHLPGFYSILRIGLIKKEEESAKSPKIVVQTKMALWEKSNK